MATFVRLVFAARDNADEVFSQHKRHAFSVYAEFLLEMAEEMAEIYVEDVAFFIHHDVVGIPVSDPENEGCDTVTCTAVGEGLDCLKVSAFIFVLLFNPSMKASWVELELRQPTGSLYVHDGQRIFDNLDQADIFSGR